MSSPWWRDSNQTASGKPGAVHRTDFDVVRDSLIELSTRARVSIHPDTPDEEVEKTFKNGFLLEIRKLIHLVEQLALEIEIPRDQAIGVDVERNVLRSGTTRPGYQDVVHIHFRRSCGLPHQTPVLALDASATKTLSEQLWGEDHRFKEIKARRKARVVQFVGAEFSTQSITGKYANGRLRPAKGSEEAAARRMQIMGFVKHLGESTCVMGSKKVLAALDDLDQLCPTLLKAHFGNLRGRNDFENCSRIVVIGREQPNCGVVEGYARSLWNTDLDPLITASMYVKEIRCVQPRRGLKVETLVPVHPDRRCQVVLEMIREREVEQAFDRLRLIHAATPKYGFILSSLVLDIDVDEVHPWLLLTSAALRVDEAAMRRDVTLLSPSWLATTHPDLFGSEHCAKRALRERRKIGALSQIGSLFGESPQFQVVTYRIPGERGKPKTAVIRLARGDLEALILQVVPNAFEVEAVIP